jgi:dihydrodipicolinate synthase/N-acetylneuraminate lyase
MLHRLDRFDFAGIISVCPYYNRPSQECQLDRAMINRGMLVAD